jgi:hypothetical protein
MNFVKQKNDYLAGQNKSIGLLKIPITAFKKIMNFNFYK